MSNTSLIILDSFALLAWLRDEPGKDATQRYLEEAEKNSVRLVMPLMNLGEVLYMTERRHGLAQAQGVEGLIAELPIEILPATRARALAAAHIKANFPISYADAFVVAASQEFNAPVLTGDPEFQSVDKLIQIEWLPQK